MAPFLNSRSILSATFVSKTADLLSPHVPIAVKSTDSVAIALERFKLKKVGSVLVFDKSGKIEGIFTERDVLTKVALSGIDPHQVQIASVMTTKVESIKHNASIARVLHLMSSGGFRHVPITYSSPEKICIISVKDVVDHIYKRLTKRLTGADPVEVAEDTTINRFFSETIGALKPFKPSIALEDNNLKSVLERISKDSVGGLVVLNKAKRITGIFTERDYITKVALCGVDINSTPVSAVMTRSPATLQNSASIAYAFNLMSEGGYRHIPITNDDEELDGLVSVRNFINVLSAGIVAELSAH